MLFIHPVFGCAAAYGLAACGRTLSSWLGWRSRLTDLGAESRFAPWAAREGWPLVGLVMAMAACVAILRDARYSASLDSAFFLLLLLMSPALGPFFFSGRWHPLVRQESEAGRFEVSRGELWERFRALFQKVGRGGAGTFHVYVVPDKFRAWAGLAWPNVLLRRRYLDRLCRAEIDGLAARQVASPQTRYALTVLPVLAYSLAAVCLLDRLNVSVLGRWLVFLFLLAAEITVLAACHYSVLLRADLRAIKLTGDAESLLSAMAELSRMNGAEPDLPSLRRIAQKTGVPPERLHALIEQRPRPAEDRYPISGDDVTTGLA